jgi:hypothetical protein
MRRHCLRSARGSQKAGPPRPARAGRLVTRRAWPGRLARSVAGRGRLASLPASTGCRRGCARRGTRRRRRRRSSSRTEPTQVPRSRPGVLALRPVLGPAVGMGTGVTTPAQRARVGRVQRHPHVATIRSCGKRRAASSRGRRAPRLLFTSATAEPGRVGRSARLDALRGCPPWVWLTFGVRSGRAPWAWSGSREFRRTRWPVSRCPLPRAA